MFDIRVKNSSNPSCINSFNPKSEAIKDIQFDPFSHSYFSAISDNGHVSIFDMRQEETPVHKFLAHTSAGICLAYHPSRNKILATGGKDKYVKLWTLPDVSGGASDDSKTNEVPLGTSPFTLGGTLNSNSNRNSNNNQHITSHSGNSYSGIDRIMCTVPRSFAMIRTPGQVNRIRWRPGNERRFESQLATSSIERNEVYVWNTNLPHLPVCVLQGHSDVVTDFQWVDSPSSFHKSLSLASVTKTTKPSVPNEMGSKQSSCHENDDEFLHVYQHIVSVSKDGKMLLQDLRNSYFPRQHIFGHGVGLSSLGDLAHHAGYVPKVILLTYLLLL